jgi:uncharacterized protein DUF2817
VGGRLHTLELTARGPSGNTLGIDIGWVGTETPRSALLHSSGIHGVEGFAGSAIQLQLLDRLPALTAGTALILTHILNPFGMAWLRRTNENNVDLNRNFIADGQYHGAPANYADLDVFLGPKSGPSRDFFLLKALLLIGRHGLSRMVQSVGGGQYEYPRGLFFGGKKLEEGPQKYHSFLRERLSSAGNVIAIDVHTGLGRFGRDLLLVERRNYEELRQVFGKRVTLTEPRYGPAYRIRGGLEYLVNDALSTVHLRFMMQEFGTYNPITVLHRLREENRWHHFGEGTLDHAVKQALKTAFCCESEVWRERVLLRGREVVEQALAVLRV